MRNIEDMKGKLFALVDEARKALDSAKTEERSLTAEETEKHDKMMADIRALEKEIEAETEFQRIEAMKAARASDPEKEQAEWRSLAEFVQTVAYNPGDPRLAERQNPQQQSVGADGGFLVPDIYSKDLLTVAPDEAIIRPRARVLTGASGADFGKLNIPALDYTVGENMFAGVRVEWIEEGGDKPETKAKLANVILQPYEVAGHIPITDRLLKNGPMIENIVRTQLREALIAAEERAFLRGAGVDQPTGIIDHAATISVQRGVADTVSYADVSAMLAQFRGRRGVWIVGRDVLPQLMVLQDANDNYIWQPSARDGNPGVLFGMPVLFSDDSPALGSDGDVVLADLSYYLIGDGVGVSLAISPHVYFTKNITVIKAWKTVDGTPWLTGPLPTTVPTSPFIQLNAAP